MDPKSFSLEKDNEFPLHLYGTECVPPPPASIPPSSIPTSPPLHLSTLPDSDRNSLHNLTFYASSFKYLSQSQLCDNLCSCSGYHTQESPTMVWYSAITVLNEIMPFIATWKDLENIILSEVNQRNTNVIWYHLYVESKKKNWYTGNYTQYFVITCKGKLSEKEYMTKSLCCTLETNTTL